MTLGLLTGPLQMLFSLLLMQGLSLTMFRTFLNQAIPRFDPMRFSMTVGNDPKLIATTPAPGNVDPQNLIPYLNILAPMVLQQQMHRQQTMNNMMQPIISNLQPSTQPQVVSAPIYATQPSYQLQAPTYQAQAFQVPAQNGQPQVIIVPQIMAPTQTTNKGSASTNFPVQISPPQINKEQNYGMPPSLTRRMLERPPKTTRRPKVVNRAHAGAIHVQFVTPRAPAGFRRFVIPPVTAQVLPDYDVTSSPESYLVNSQSSNSVTDSSDFGDNIEAHHSLKEDIPLTTTSSVDENVVDIIDLFNSVSTTTPLPVTTPSSEDNQTIASIEKTTEVSDKETIDDKNLLNHRMKDTNNLTENMLSINDLIHKDFDEYVRNISLNQIDSNQSQDIYFENSKGVPFNETNSYQLINNSL